MEQPDTIHIALTRAEAKMLCHMLDLAIRVSIGQFEEINYLVRIGFIPMHGEPTGQRMVADIDTSEAVWAGLREAKLALGFGPSEYSSVYHPHTPEEVAVAYELLLDIYKKLYEEENDCSTNTKRKAQPVEAD